MQNREGSSSRENDCCMFHDKLSHTEIYPVYEGKRDPGGGTKSEGHH